jgi:hypothetical protein
MQNDAVRVVLRDNSSDITRNPPPPGSRVLVYGAGALGTTVDDLLR